MNNNACGMAGKVWIQYTMVVFAIVSLLLMGACAKKIRSDYPNLKRSGDKTAGDMGSQGTDQGSSSDDSSLSEKGLDDDTSGGVDADETSEARAAREKFENDDIYFEYDSAALLPEAQSLLMEKAEWLKNRPGTAVVIEGHTDERGTVEYNLALGDRRAESVRSFLMELGVDTGSIRTISYGEENPIDPGQSESAWAKNRRAHFFVEK